MAIDQSGHLLADYPHRALSYSVLCAPAEGLARRAILDRVTNNLAGRLHDVQDRIRKACDEVGRNADEVRLLAVSKTKPAADVAALHDLGLTDFGENKVQEAVAKAEELHHLDGLSWSLIGHLQKNKAKFLTDFAAEFQALDSLELAKNLDRRFEAAGRPLPVLIQVNSSGEESKFGLAPEDVPAFARELGACSSLEVRGLMTLATNSADADVVAACFTRMREVQNELRNDDRAAGSYDELSMGMSGDFELAIRHGSTCVRIGQGLFGARDYSNG